MAMVFQGIQMRRLDRGPRPHVCTAPRRDQGKDKGKDEGSCTGFFVFTLVFLVKRCFLLQYRPYFIPASTNACTFSIGVSSER